MRAVRFFAHGAELRELMREVERVVPLIYVQCKHCDRPEVPVYESIDAVPGIGIASAESQIACDAFLVAPTGTPVRFESFRLNTGEMQYYVDQLRNPTSVVLRVGGVWNGSVILPGEVSTCMGTRESGRLVARFGARVRKRFTRVGAYWVAPEAMEWLKAGKRLTVAEQTPEEFDLRL